MSEGNNIETSSWILAGCGSLGSKIALHLARSGRAPIWAIDKSTMRPHNAARHGLRPNQDEMQVLWTGDKAQMLAAAIRGLGQCTKPLITDVIDLLQSAEAIRNINSKNTWGFVNATASLAVREACASLSPTIFPIRVIETSLYAEGNIGTISYEGPERNPNTADLITEAYSIMRENRKAKSLLFGKQQSLERRHIGEGCGSFTMKMSDARLSLFAAGMAESIAFRQRSGLDKANGELLIGILAEGQMGVSWENYFCPPVQRINIENNKFWHIHIHKRASDNILQEVARWPHSETGGIIVGRISETTHTFHIIDTLPAPTDSIRSASQFVLGTEGVTKALKNYGSSAGWALYCLGTWHSHLVSSGPSNLDKQTARSIAISRLAPSALLIYTPGGFQAILAKK